MKNNRRCLTDSNMKMAWENELQNDLNSLKNANIGEITRLFKILSNTIRLQILMLLLKRDYCVCELVYLLKEKQNLISYNLSMLKQYQIVDSYNRSKDKYYELNLEGDSVDVIKYVKENLIVGF